MNSKLGFALIGCGRIANKHADILSRNKINNAQIVAVCDHNKERAKSFGDKYELPWYTDYHQMLAEMHAVIDVVSILTESGNHASNTIDIAKYKKHIVVEKPMALTLDDADSMIKVCDENNIKLFIVKQNRYNLPIIKVREAVVNNRFGKIVLGTVRVRWCRKQDYYDQDSWRGTWAMDGGVFTNQASHHIDVLEWMLGEPVSVFAKSTTALVNIEAEDTGVALIKFKSGALGIVEATTATRPNDLEGSLSILGENGTVEVSGFALNHMKLWNFVDKIDGDDEVSTKFTQNPPNVYGFGHVAYLQHVVDAVQHNKPSLIDGLEGRKSLELITAIYESIETGKEVFLKFNSVNSRLGKKRSQ